MKNKLAKVTCLAIVAASLVAWPAISRAEDSTNAPAAQTPAPKKHGLPFHGKVASVDPAAMTFTVGSTTVAITSTTKITKNGEPAVFADITAGEVVSGSYKKDADGKLNATTVRIGAKKKNADAPATTNAPPAQ
jgi:hypothetical protein